jgi:hypothetical protein
MATRLSIAMRKEEATKRISGTIEQMAQRCAVALPAGVPATKDPDENQAVLLETLAAQLEALAPFAQPVEAPVIEAFDVPKAGRVRK